MELRVLLLLWSLFWCNKIAAQEPAWTLQPSVCIAKKVGDLCQLNLHIKTENMPSELFCLFLDEESLICSQQAYFPQKIPIEFKKDVLLELKNQTQKTILSKQLKIKYLEPNGQRRRIRAPWSLF